MLLKKIPYISASVIPHYHCCKKTAHIFHPWRVTTWNRNWSHTKRKISCHITGLTLKRFAYFHINALSLCRINQYTLRQMAIVCNSVTQGSDSGSGNLAIYDMPVVVSGIADRFPKSENSKALKENLLAGVDLVTEWSAQVSVVYPSIHSYLNKDTPVIP